MTTSALIAAISCVALTALVESSPRVRLPLGLMLAVVMLGADLELLPVVLLGALGATLGRGVIAFEARRGRAPRSPAASRSREDALRERLARSKAYGRVTFATAALPLVPATFLFSLLGAMRAPLLPALAGSFTGLVPVLAITTSICAALGRWLAGDSQPAALPIGVFAVVLLLIRSLALVDWDHRRATGTWRMRDPEPRLRVFGGSLRSSPGDDTPDDARPRRGELPDADPDASDVIEGEVLGEEEIVDPHDD